MAVGEALTKQPELALNPRNVGYLLRRLEDAVSTPSPRLWLPAVALTGWLRICALLSAAAIPS
jgi:hypothetical protein